MALLFALFLACFRCSWPNFNQDPDAESRPVLIFTSDLLPQPHTSNCQQVISIWISDGHLKLINFECILEIGKKIVLLPSKVPFYVIYITVNIIINKQLSNGWIKGHSSSFFARSIAITLPSFYISLHCFYLQFPAFGPHSHLPSDSLHSFLSFPHQTVDKILILCFSFSAYCFLHFLLIFCTSALLTKFIPCVFQEKLVGLYLGSYSTSYTLVIWNLHLIN